MPIKPDLPTFDADAHENRGFFKVSDDVASGGKTPTERERRRLLQLLFTLCYTREGHELLEKFSVNNGMREEDVRHGLSKYLDGRYDLAPAVRNALIEAHLAADAFVKAQLGGKADEQTRHGTIYAEQMRAVLHALHEDALGLEFSLAW